MGKFAGLFEKYDRLVLFDTETTGLTFSRDEIIEFAAIVVEQEERSKFRRAQLLAKGEL